MTNDKKCKIRITDEINVLVLGLLPSEYKHFYNKFGIQAEGYFFNRNFKLGRWDGKNRFFSENGKTYVQLLPDIVADLRAMQYKIELIDDRSPVSIEVPQIEKDYLGEFGIELGEHQVNAINAATYYNNGIVIAGTGAGKTYCTAIVCDLYNKYANFKCLVIVPTLDLINQTHEEFVKLNLDTGKFGDGYKELDHKIVISTWQSLKNDMPVASMFQAIIVDECHGAKAKVIKEILNDYGNKAIVKLGFTGTLPKDESDAMSLRVCLGDVRYRIPSHELIAAGWLANLKLKVIKLEEDFKDKWEAFQLKYPEEAAKINYKKFKDAYFPDFASEREYLQKKADRCKFITDYIQTTRDLSGNCFVLVNSIAAGKKLSKLVPNSYFVYGKDSTEVRKEIYKLFETHDDVIVFSTFQLASTGLNIKRIFNLFLIDGNKSFIQIIQSIGRGLRKSDDKDTVFVYDMGSDLKYSRKHLNQRKKHYKEQKYKFVENDIDYKKYIDN